MVRQSCRRCAERDTDVREQSESPTKSHAERIDGHASALDEAETATESGEYTEPLTSLSFSYFPRRRDS